MKWVHDSVTETKKWELHRNVTKLRASKHSRLMLKGRNTTVLIVFFDRVDGFEAPSCLIGQECAPWGRLKESGACKPGGTCGCGH